MSDTPNVQELLQAAPVNDEAQAALQKTAAQLGPDVGATQGVLDANDVDADAIVLLTTVVDDSFSIKNANNDQNVRDGHNIVIDAMRNSQQSAAVVASCLFLNNAPGTDMGVLYPYMELDNVPLLDENNYFPTGGTPLYDRVAVALTGAIAKIEEFESRGVPVRAITVIVSDGADQHSRHHDAESINQIVANQLASERHIIAAVGIQDPKAKSDFRVIFSDMGILPDWILTPGNTTSEIRKAFSVLSIRAVEYTRGRDGYSTTLIGLGADFHNPS